jgi:GSH-dependent disulfide-bond oxidoreductase
MIDLYFWPTPNGKKITIFLEETGVPYKLIPVNIGRGDQFSPDFLALNPNHRMPVIVDRKPAGGGAPISVLESGAILMYLAEKSGQLLPQTPREKYEVVQWVFWQMANQGPKFGECGHFRRAAQDPKNGDLTYALRRFDDEVNRLFGVLNNRLHDRRYLAGDTFSIADIISYPWSLSWERLGQNLDEFKYVKRWLEDLGSRPGVQRGMEIGKDLAVDNENLSKEEAERRAKILQNQRALPVGA